MISTKKKRTTLGMGHDAFLDIVANLVGVLIILIAVFSGTSTALVQEAERRVQEEVLENPDLIPATDKQVSELNRLASRAVGAHADSDHFEQRVARFDEEIHLTKAGTGCTTGPAGDCTTGLDGKTAGDGPAENSGCQDEN